MSAYRPSPWFESGEMPRGPHRDDEQMPRNGGSAAQRDEMRREEPSDADEATSFVRDAIQRSFR